MAAALISSLAAFRSETKDATLGKLLQALAADGFDISQLQADAWGRQIDLLFKLRDEILRAEPESHDWTLLLEFRIPRRERRPDAVLIAGNVIFILEFKVGTDTYDEAARWQAHSYALDLADFHSESHGHTLVPVLVATDAREVTNEASERGHVWPVQRHNASTLSKGILQTYRAAHDPHAGPIDAERWNESPYRPSLTIIQAAEELYRQHTVREISHSYADNLSATTTALVEAVQAAQSSGQRVICFVTGVPGAGKTLAGLNAVHDPILREEDRPAAVFLSGNAPLVKIIRAALAKNCREPGVSKREFERRIRTFVQNVHSFLKEYGSSDRVPPENVIVFDEAQRAWNAEQCERKERGATSEPAQLLDVMSRAPNWSVIVALVGGGQEIHTGEAGLAEWGRAVASRPERWHIRVSPEALDGGASLAGSRLFEDALPEHLIVLRDEALHLRVSVRSPRAAAIAEWTNHVLEGRAQEARAVSTRFDRFPLAITRELSTAMQWLRNHCPRDYRCGLIASSGALRHRNYGIELSSGFRRGYQYEHWFLGDRDDVRSSDSLEVAATEFEIQGLEIDWTGVCWGNDFRFSPRKNSWAFGQFKGSKWLRVKQARQQEFVRNKYRVLLTRARQGMIIWVPRGVESDRTIAPESFDGTAEFLQQAGVPLV